MQRHCLRHMGSSASCVHGGCLDHFRHRAHKQAAGELGAAPGVRYSQASPSSSTQWKQSASQLRPISYTRQPYAHMILDKIRGGAISGFCTKISVQPRSSPSTCLTSQLPAAIFTERRRSRGPALLCSRAQQVVHERHARTAMPANVWLIVLDAPHMPARNKLAGLQAPGGALGVVETQPLAIG